MPSLTFDEIDDLLYFTRANEASDLQQTLTELTQKYNCTPQEILSSAIDPETGNTVLHYCSANGLADLLTTLLPQTTSLLNHQNALGNTPLHWAAYNGHLPVVKQLIEAGADMWLKNQAGHLAMFEAERADKSDVVQYLLEAGGKDVERGGVEGQPSAAEEMEVQNGDAEPGSSKQAEGGVELNGEGEGRNG